MTILCEDLGNSDALIVRKITVILMPFMKIHVLSDLHTEFWRGRGLVRVKDTDADVVVIAGDVHWGPLAIEWIRNNVKKPAIFVLGNHEYYEYGFPFSVVKVKGNALRFKDIHVLERDEVKIEDTVFLGTTLWTDFALFGNVSKTAEIVRTHVNDFKKIRVVPGNRLLHPLDTVKFHHDSMRFLAEKLKEHRDKNVVIVTHHAPSPRSLDGHFVNENKYVAAAFASDLEDFICEHPNIRLWIHGHIHRFKDYKICNTRIVCNPFGYPVAPVKDFTPDFVVEI